MILKNRKGQAFLEYILMVVMLAVTMAVVIRKTNRTIYFYWTGLARQIASPCVDCKIPAAPDLQDRFDPVKDTKYTD